MFISHRLVLSAIKQIISNSKPVLYRHIQTQNEETFAT